MNGWSLVAGHGNEDGDAKGHFQSLRVSVGEAPTPTPDRRLGSVLGHRFSVG